MPPPENINTLKQLQGLRLAPELPLIVTDADEVLVEFISGLERYLEANDYWLDLKSFAITGNVRRKDNSAPLNRDQVQELLGAFFASDTEILDPVEGAAAALRALHPRSQILVLSNVPLPQAQARRNWLHRHGMNYPLIANSGSKADAMRYLVDNTTAPVFFLDDLPPHIEAVAAAAPGVHLLHFIANARLSSLIGPAKQCHLRTSSWTEAQAFIEQRLDALGY